MAIVSCPECQKKLKVADASVGKKVKCSCGQVFVAQSEVAAAAPSPVLATTLDKVVVACTECGAKLKVAGASLGKKMKCPKCAAVFVAAAEVAALPPAKKEPLPAKTDDADDLLAFGQEEVNGKPAHAAEDDLFTDSDDMPSKAKPGKKSGPEMFADEDDAPPAKGKPKKMNPDDDEEDAPRPKGKADKKGGKPSLPKSDDEKPVYASRLLLNILVAFMTLGFVAITGALFFGDAVGKLVGLKDGLHADLIGIPKPNRPKGPVRGLGKHDIERMRAAENKKDLDNLEGTWVIDSVDVVHAPGAVANARVFSKGDEYVFDADKLSTKDLKDAPFTLDANPIPKTLDFTTAEGSFAAIYKFEGDKLEWYMGFPKTVKVGDKLTPGERPTHFDLKNKGGLIVKLHKKKAGTENPKDALKLDGTWVIDSAAFMEKFDNKLKGEKFIFANGKVTGPDLEDASVKLDPSKEPAWIDIETPTGKVLGIYRGFGDTVKMCLGVADADNKPASRPKNMDPKEGRLFVLKRQKTKDGDGKETAKDTEEQTQAKVDAAKAQLAILTQATQAFRIKNGEYPETLKELVEGEPRYLKNKDALLDPWKRPYQYDSTGAKNDGKRPDIWFVSPAKEMIGNWMKEEKGKEKEKDNEKDNDKEKEAAKLEGAWIVESSALNGKPDDGKNGDAVVFADGKLKGLWPNPRPYTVDGGKDPKSIDVILDEKTTLLGIYKIDEEKLFLALPRKDPSERPKSFDGKIGVVVLLRRATKDDTLYSRGESQINLKRIGVAIHGFHDDIKNKSFPPAGISSRTDPTRKPLLSWRVAVLPYLGDKESTALYKEFDLDKSWDDPHNMKLIAKMPPVFVMPFVKAKEGMTHYRTLVGPGTVMAGKRNISGITDGAFNTVLVVEAKDPTIWTKPDDLPYDPEGPLPKFGVCPVGFNVLMADGTTRFVRSTVSEEVLRPYLTGNNGMPREPLDAEKKPKDKDIKD